MNHNVRVAGHGSRPLGLKRKVNLKRPIETAGGSSDEEVSTRVELSPQKSSSIIVTEKPFNKGEHWPTIWTIIRKVRESDSAGVII